MHPLIVWLEPGRKMAQSDLLPRTSHFQLTTISRFTSSIEIVFVFSESTCFPKVLLGLSRPTFIQKTLVEIAMDLSTYSGSFLSNSHVSASFGILGHSCTSFRSASRGGQPSIFFTWFIAETRTQTWDWRIDYNPKSATSIAIHHWHQVADVCCATAWSGGEHGQCEGAHSICTTY